MIKYENEPFKQHIFISNQNLWYELQKTAVFSWKKISLSCETPDNVFPLVQANLKFACREYKNLQFEKRKTIQRRMLKI